MSEEKAALLHQLRTDPQVVRTALEGMAKLADSNPRMGGSLRYLIAQSGFSHLHKMPPEAAAKVFLAAIMDDETALRVGRILADAMEGKP